MEIKDLAIFLSAYKELSLSKAAEKNFTTQPAVSRKISTLEEEYGKQFFHRSNRGLVPTNAGITFAGYAEQFICLYKESLLKIRRDKDQKNSNLLSIAALTPAAGWFLPDVLTDFLEKYPDTELILDYYTPAEMIENIENNYYDLYITIETDLMAAEGMHYIRLIRDTLSLVTKQKDAPQNEEDAINILKNKKIYTISPVTSPSCYRVFLQLLKQLDLTEQVTVNEILRVNTLKYYVLSNMGCLVVPPYLDSMDDPSLAHYRFKNGPEYNMDLGWKEETPIIRSFLKILKENVSLPADYSLFSK